VAVDGWQWIRMQRKEYNKQVLYLVTQPGCGTGSGSGSGSGYVLTVALTLTLAVAVDIVKMTVAVAGLFEWGDLELY
jgi:hypothetical protein